MIVTTTSLSAVINNCKQMIWQVPNFQREFVWSNSQVEDLIESVLKGYTIGMITLWEQPPLKPYTQSRPISLTNGTNNNWYFDGNGNQISCPANGIYGFDFINDPAVGDKLPQIHLIIDGRQRMTALASIFSDFYCTNQRKPFSGGWFVDFAKCASISGDPSEFIKYYKHSEISHHGLNTVAGCINKGIFPLKDIDKIAGSYIGQIHNPTMYPGQVVPRDANDRVDVLSKIQTLVTSTSIPVGQIPQSVSLSQICEIFKVLNQTGTKVSVFDLLHNIHYGNSGSTFELRAQVKSLNYLPYLSSLISDSREDYFCQIVTGLTAGAQLLTNPGQLYTLKSNDLLNTPLQNYLDFFNNTNLIESWLSDLYGIIYNGYVPVDLKEIAYPASLIIYLSLRWRHHLSQVKPYSVNQLNKVYSIFYWRNLLNQRYDQGFLTKFRTDIKNIDDFLGGNEKDYISNNILWNHNVESWFNTNDMKQMSISDLQDICLNDGLRGAISQALTLLMKGKTTHSIVSGMPLNYQTNKIQMHHVFPRNWVRSNKQTNPSVMTFGDSHFANLVPLDATSNVNWSASAPSNYINNTKLIHNAHFNNALIDIKCFNNLIADDIQSFWNNRSLLIANELDTLQKV